MKKITKHIKVVILLTLLLLTGCSKSNIEQQLEQESLQITKKFETNSNIHLNIEKKPNHFLVYPDEHRNNPFTMFIPNNFYELEKFEIPKIIEEKNLPKKHNEMLINAKNIVLDYIDSSIKIKKNDKQLAKKAIENIILHYGKFTEKRYSDIAMVTVETEIYINNTLSNYISEYTYLHELIHIVSNITNKGSKYEYSSYRASNLNEAITDLISSKLAEKNNLSGMNVSAYQIYYEPTNYILEKFDMLEIFFYSEGYDKVISQIGQNELDLYILMMDNFEECNEAFPYLINEILKEE